MPDTSAIDTIISTNAQNVRKVQFCQQVKMTQNAPEQIARITTQAAASKTSLKIRILDAQVITDLGTDYDVVKAAVDAL